MKTPIYSARSATRAAACVCLGGTAVGAALIINPTLLLPLVALGGAASTVELLWRDNVDLRSKLADERDRAATLRRACAEAIEALPDEGGVAIFLAAALLAAKPQAKTQPHH